MTDKYPRLSSCKAFNPTFAICSECGNIFINDTIFVSDIRCPLCKNHYGLLRADTEEEAIRFQKQYKK